MAVVVPSADEASEGDSPAVAASPWPNGRTPELVSVVIPVYNATDTLGVQLDALRQQDYAGAVEIVLADNGSTDGLREWLDGWQDARVPVRIVDASDRRGVSHARNVGCRAAAGDLIAICDADDIVSLSWISSLVAVARYAGVVGGSLDGVRLNTAQVRAGRMVHDPHRLTVKLDFLPYAPGGNLAVWSEVVQQIGGWDEEMLGADDVDFSWRAQFAGYSVAPSADAVIHYRYRTTLRGLARQMYTYAAADVLLYKRYRAQGAKRRPLRLLRRDLWLLASRSPYLLFPLRRGTWVNRAAQLAGRVAGSWRYRTWYV